MQYHTHDERYLMIDKVKQAKVLVDATLAAMPTYYEVINGFDDETTEGTTIPDVPNIVYCKGSYKTNSIAWDTQQLLTPVHWYEIMVSDNETNWYGLRTDGEDWKADEDVPTVVYGNLFQHSGIPLGGTDEEPTSVTLYYRVRRKTINEVSAANPSAWSDTSSATVEPIGEGGIEALSIGADKIMANSITAAKIAASTITAAEIATSTLQALFAQISSLYVAFAGTGSFSEPDEGDLAFYFNQVNLLLQEYTDGNWSNANAIRIGGVDSNGVFISGVSCRQVVNPLAEEVNQEFIPGGTFLVYPFTEDYANQHGDTDSGRSDCELTTAWSKFGTKSLSGRDPGDCGYRRYEDLVTVNTNTALGFWIKVDGTFTGAEFSYRQKLASYVYYTSKHSFFTQLYYNIMDGLLYVYFQEEQSPLPLTQQVTVSLSITPAELKTGDHYIAYSMDFNKGKLYLMFDNKLSSANINLLSFSGEDPTLNETSITVYNQRDIGSGYTFTTYVSELSFSTSENADLDIFLQHYYHNQPWNPDYSAKDLILRPADGGYVNLQNSPTKYYAPVSGEESFGTPVPLSSGVLIVSDTSIDDTWETADCSAYIPDGATAVYGWVEVRGESTANAAWVSFQYYGDTNSDAYHKYGVITQGALASSYTKNGCIQRIPIKDGKFQYRRTAAVYLTSRVLFYLQGYYI